MSYGELWAESSCKRLFHQEGNGNDSSGGGYNWTDTNIAFGISHGKFGQGAGFNGSSSRQDGADTGLPTSTGARTVSFWVKLNAVPGKGQENTMLAYATDNANYKYYGQTIISIGSTKYLRTAFWGYDVDTPFPFTTGVWYNIVVVHDGSCKQYINGKRISNVSRPLADTTLKQAFVGYLKPFSSGWLNGDIDEIAYYNVAKSDQWVRRNYARGVGKLE